MILFIVANHLHNVNKLEIMFAKEFDIKGLGIAKKILVMNIYDDTNARKLWLSQKIYVEKVLEKFDKSNLKIVSTLLVNHFKLSLD